jgi:ribosome-binding factor A
LLEKLEGTLSLPQLTHISPATERNATVFVSVFPDTQSEHAIAFLNRHRDTLRDYLKKGSRLTHIPRITFQIDLGEKTRQRLDDITRDLT